MKKIHLVVAEVSNVSQTSRKSVSEELRVNIHGFYNFAMHYSLTASSARLFYVTKMYSISHSLSRKV